MSGKLHPPLLTPKQAEALLDQVVYEQVLECIDLDALHRLEQSLTMMVGELDGIPDDQVDPMATAMLDRALHRLPADLRGYLRAAGWLPAGNCALCDDESPPGDKAPPRHSPTRLKS
ncbi:MAG TPA: hypothetical protein VHN14_36165 [Kofleriaceae bacterium]|jgi:hypothetical protein|nr:hypothetical protein [Kofleriaceae bacterium]